MNRQSAAIKIKMPETVETFLRENPSCLSERPDLMRTLTPPSRYSDSDPISDFQQAMIEGLKSDLDRLSRTSADIITLTQSNLSQQQRTHAAVLRLMQAATPADFHRVLTQDWPRLLDVDAVALVLEDDTAQQLSEGPSGIVRVPKGMVDGIFLDHPGQLTMLTPERNGNILFGDLAPRIHSDALARFDLTASWECKRVHQSGQIASVPTGLLALGSFCYDTFTPEQATDLLEFLSRVLGSVLVRWCALIP